METNSRAPSLRHIMLLCLLILLGVPQFASADTGTYLGMWPQLDGYWYFERPSAVAVDNNSGNVYVVDASHYRILKLGPDGALLTKWGAYDPAGPFAAHSGGLFKEPAGIVLDSIGNVYVVDTSRDDVQKFDSNGNFLTKWGQWGSGDGDLYRPTSIAVDSLDNIYIADSSNARIEKFDSSGNYLSQFGTYSYPPGPGEFQTPYAVAVDSAGNIYVCDNDGNNVQKFGPDGTPMARWVFSHPQKISVDSAGFLYIESVNYDLSYKIEKFDSSGNLQDTWGNAGRIDTLYGIAGVTLDSSGTIYVADTGGSRIQKFGSDATFISTWQSYGSDAGQLSRPNGVSVDSSGNVYVADTSNNRVQKFSSTGEYLTSWDGSAGDAGQLSGPYGIAVSSGTTPATTFVFVTDTNNNRVQKFDANGVYKASWDGSTSDGGVFKAPAGIAVYGNNVYVVDTQNSHIQQFDLDGNYIYHWGWAGTANADLWQPMGIAADSSGNLYVTDTGNNGVKMYSGSGAQQYPNWGDGGVLGTPGSDTGQFNNPTGIAVDAAGNIYVADTGNGRIQMFKSDGTFLSSWGTAGSDNGQFYGPTGIAIKTNGSIYVADNANSRIQYFSSDVIADTEKPVVTAFTIPTTATSLTVNITTLTATDNTAVTGYLITAVATAPLATATGWGTNAPTSYTFTAAGAKTLYAWAKDAAGNVSLGVSASTTVTVTPADTTKPVVSAFTVPATAKSLTVSPLTITATDNVAVTAYQITESATAPATDDTKWNATKPTSYSFADGTGDGLKTLYAWAKDAAGNVSLAKTATVTVNTTLPVVTAFTVTTPVSTLIVPVTSLSVTDSGTIAGYMITATETAPLATATGWSTAKPTTFTAPSAATTTLYAWAKDSAGNVSVAKTATVKIDTAKPVVATFTVTTPVNSLTVPVTAFSATDDTGVTGYLITTVATAPLATASGWGTNVPTSYTAAANSVKTLYAWAKDAAGNVSLGKTAAVVIDTTKPVVSTFTVPATASSLTVAGITITATDNVAVASYQITESATAPATDDTKWNTTKPTGYAFAAGTADGLKTLYAWAKDTAGNVSLAKTATVAIDTTLPVVTAFTVPATVKALAIPVTSFVVTDSGTIAGYMITATETAPLATATGWSTAKPTTFTAPSAATTTLYAWAKDSAGNVSVAKTATVKIDTAKPVVATFTVTTPVNSLTVPVTAFSATDDTGVTGYLITAVATAPLATATGWGTNVPTSYTAAANSVKTLYAWAKDAAGNVSLGKTAAVVIDTTKPVVSAFTVPATASSLTVAGITITATDNVAVASYQITESATAPATDDTKWNTTKPTGYAFAAGTADGLKTLYAWAKDTAGNVSLAKTATVAIDTTLPVVTAFTVPATVKALAIPVTSFVVTDSGTIAGYMITATETAPLATATGWSTAKPTTFTAPSAATTTLYAWAKDSAGNVSVAKTATVKIDTAKPVVATFTVTTPVNSLTVPVTAFSATDDTGVTGYLITAVATAPLATATGWGTNVPTSYTAAANSVKTLYAWAKDAAGNVSLGKTAAVVIDTTKPVVSAFTVPATASSLTVAGITITATDNVAVASYQITESATAPATDDTKWNTTKPTGYAFAAGTADGLKTLYAWAKDTAGNVSLAKTAQVTVKL